MDLADLPGRIGGTLIKRAGEAILELPYFEGLISISRNGIRHPDGSDLGRWEQVFVLNHMAQGGSRQPTGRWKALQEFPNTVSKIKSMRTHVEAPLSERFTGRRTELAARALAIGGVDRTVETASADLAIRFQPLPRIPVMLLFWDADAESGFEAEVKLSFDETIVEHLDIESIMFLSEHLAKRLMAE